MAGAKAAHLVGDHRKLAVVITVLSRSAMLLTDDPSDRRIERPSGLSFPAAEDVLSVGEEVNRRHTLLVTLTGPRRIAPEARSFGGTERPSLPAWLSLLSTGSAAVSRLHHKAGDQSAHSPNDGDRGA